MVLVLVSATTHGHAGSVVRRIDRVSACTRQIIVAIVGALVMLVVGQSLARAFGIVGAASLIRYRAKIDDPKDAGVMLTALGIGLASGVGLYLLAARDGRELFVGSQSLRPLELDRRREVGIIVRDAAAIKRFRTTFEADWSEACSATSARDDQASRIPA